MIYLTDQLLSLKHSWYVRMKQTYQVVNSCRGSKVALKDMGEITGAGPRQSANHMHNSWDVCTVHTLQENTYISNVYLRYIYLIYMYNSLGVLCIYITTEYASYMIYIYIHLIYVCAYQLALCDISTSLYVKRTIYIRKLIWFSSAPGCQFKLL